MAKEKRWRFRRKGRGGDATETWRRRVQREILCLREREREHKTKPVRKKYVKMRADLHVSLRYRLMPKSSFVQRYATLKFPLQIYIPWICPTRHASARRRSKDVKYLLYLQSYAQPRNLTKSNLIRKYLARAHVYKTPARDATLFTITFTHVFTWF